MCVVPLSQPSSRDVLYVTYLCVLSRYLSPVGEICYMLHICACVARYLSPVVELFIILSGMVEKKCIKKRMFSLIKVNRVNLIIF